MALQGARIDEIARNLSPKFKNLQPGELWNVASEAWVSVNKEDSGLRDMGAATPEPTRRSFSISGTPDSRVGGSRTSQLLGQ